MSKAKPKANLKPRPAALLPCPATHDVNQISLGAAIGHYLERQEGVRHMKPRHFNAIIQAANLIVAEFARPDRIASPGAGLEAWLASDDTGRSSEFMACFLAGPRGPAEWALPLDADDFGRCVRMLDVVPHLRPRLPDMSVACPDWAALVRAWPELETLYRAGELAQVSGRLASITAREAGGP